MSTSGARSCPQMQRRPADELGRSDCRLAHRGRLLPLEITSRAEWLETRGAGPIKQEGGSRSLTPSSTAAPISRSRAALDILLFAHADRRAKFFRSVCSATSGIHVAGGNQPVARGLAALTAPGSDPVMASSSVADRL